ncbi:MAG: pyridoxal-5'-phosphate-dependent protein [Burkholderiales bacterium 35-55-47]|jgi:dTDP-4-amino-4,6-dideoxygalactose transaminase|uniref:DegT/DnrJ/EryC1/StrS family aminotransferase n=1 Tax=Limnohabitans sp. TaxID=1907725 RepID=UPI000BD22B7D|nr:DegT/DnrJ/EryC1/StrS family aminotransferase [Limnohabitans sp.]OYY18133.1 MAG: pyridoxal-5'-phosphate-dependent protein [Burkholderiales bacterium 35-55-47]OYZ72546.1 MAG: pyridoxal-5'-phosphate-dependent protein [Burkholderiales bacterium 24-55-52]OZA99978.1 MAG: pyridoxal-5'-phosphate-dependent protein [Burkholderiales bacterium 39-55-53]HQR87059.1 DegT/DnrJ/EryC1/StrS family aminotransferase [Limnohabitans sp.]HQS26843.1 DegT/DnrJ/EryC1/StrS family aminotransferase [Limnohabitans sp.]
MTVQKLALFGGSPVIAKAMSPFQSMGEDEIQAASEVIRGGVLSAYIGASGPGFMGGERVRQFEQDVSRFFNVKHALAVNSWTSGLIAAIGAIGLEPGDEVITTTWTMAATATAILHWNCIPIFADIHPDTFNICPVSVEKNITSRTRAILAVDIFGQSANMRALRDIADRHGLYLLSDTAQAPGAVIDSEFAGTLADIGGFSLNYHKHIHCGEGGVLVTQNDHLAHRLSLIRNHAEAVINSEDPVELCNMIGYNFRMGEIEAAIASKQLPKLNGRILSRQRIAAELEAGLSHLQGIQTPLTSPGSSHVYYVYGLKLNINELGVDRSKIVAALRAEGVPYLMPGYQNIHLLPLFKNKIAYGTRGFPWTSTYCSSSQQYAHGLCPVAEELHANSFLGLNICMNELPPNDVSLIISAFQKVWANLANLQ